MTKQIGVIGMGSIGKRHADNLASLGYLVLPYDTNGESKNSLEDVLYTSEALVIATPSADHAFQILTARKGIPLFVEKPIGVSSSDSIEVAATLRHGKNTIMVGCNLRFHPAVLEAKLWMDSRRQHKPIWANFTCAQFSDKDPYKRDGVTLNWGAHEIDLALYLLGPARVIASAINEDDSIADIILLHDNGCRTTVHLDYHTKNEIRGFNIESDEYSIKVLLPERFLDLNGQMRRFAGSYDDDYLDEMKAFIDRIDGKETPGATGADGLAALDIILQAKEMA